jgi:hypothetical protein
VTLEIAILLVAFAGTSLGVFGKSWDTERKGWRKLRPSGYAALSIAAAALVLSGVQASRKSDAASAERQQTRTMRAIGIVKLQAAVDRLYSPIVSMRSSHDRTRFYYYGDDSFDMPLDVLADEDFKAWLRGEDMYSPVRFGDDQQSAGYTWAQLVHEEVARAADEIESCRSTLRGFRQA